MVGGSVVTIVDDSANRGNRATLSDKDVIQNVWAPEMSGTRARPSTAV